mgnify:CR=1 FL=1
MNTFFVHLNATAITYTTDGIAKTLTFRNKRTADKKIIELLAAGYTIDRLGWAAYSGADLNAINPDYVPAPEGK